MTRRRAHACTAGRPGRAALTRCACACRDARRRTPRVPRAHPRRCCPLRRWLTPAWLTCSRRAQRAVDAQRNAARQVSCVQAHRNSAHGGESSGSMKPCRATHAQTRREHVPSSVGKPSMRISRPATASAPDASGHARSVHDTRSVSHKNCRGPVACTRAYQPCVAGCKSNCARGRARAGRSKARRLGARACKGSMSTRHVSAVRRFRRCASGKLRCTTRSAFCVRAGRRATSAPP